MEPTRGRSLWPLLVLVLLFACAARAPFLNRPFERDPEGCGSYYGLLARNYFRWPIAQTHLVPVQSLGVGHGPPAFYPNHPALLPLLIAGTFKLCGFDPAGYVVPPPWQVRFSSAAFVLGCIVLIYWMLRRVGSERAAILAACLFAIAPMTLLYGGQPDVINGQLDFFILLTVAAYLHFHARPGLPRLALLLLAFLPAGLTDWPAYFILPVIGVHFLFTQPPRRWLWMAGLVPMGLLFFVPWAQGYSVTHDLHWMSALVERRSVSTVADSTGRFTTWQWFRDGLFGHAWRRHNGPIFPLALVWLGLAVTVWRKRPETRLIGLLFAWAILHILVGRQGVFVHQWWWWPLTPAVVMASAVVIDVLCDYVIQRGLRPQIAGIILAAGLTFMAAWNVWHIAVEFAHPQQITARHDDPLNYSLAEIGQTIRDAVPPNTSVLLGENDMSLSLWYYADRPLRQNIWWVGALQQAMTDGLVDLPFPGIPQQWTGRPGAFIIPRYYLTPRFDNFVRYLDAHGRRTELPKFIVWRFE